MIQVTASNFNQEVIDCETTVAVLFTTEWCGSTYILTPILNKVQRKFQDKVKFCSLDMEGEKSIAEKYGIYEIPTVLIFNRGQIVDFMKGTFTQSEMEKKLDRVMHEQLDLDVG